jgi:hypothetical protein
MTEKQPFFGMFGDYFGEPSLAILVDRSYSISTIGRTQ